LSIFKPVWIGRVAPLQLYHCNTAPLFLAQIGHFSASRQDLLQIWRKFPEHGPACEIVGTILVPGGPYGAAGRTTILKQPARAECGRRWSRLATSVIVGVVSQTLIGCSRWQRLRMAKTAEDPIFVSMGCVFVAEYVGFLFGPGTHHHTLESMPSLAESFGDRGARLRRSRQEMV
jgi:hypothetical protein